MKTLKSMRLQIGVFGRTNVGKSSILNRLTNQEISIVSDIAGTTTDVVEKSMELLPIGPVTFLDTAGLDDTTELGEKRVEKTLKVLNRIDVAVIVCDYKEISSKLGISDQNNDYFDDCEKELIEKLDDLKIPYLIIINKCDLNKNDVGVETPTYNSKVVSGIKDDRTLRREDDKSKTEAICRHSERLAKESSNTNLTQLQEMKINLNETDHASLPLCLLASNPISCRHSNADLPVIFTSAKSDEQLVFKFKEALVKLLPEEFVNPPKIVGDLVPPKSTVILVIPVDKEAPKGRIILPQVQTLRDLLDSECLSYVVKESELKQALDNLKTPPALVVTDSQAFRQVSEIVPENVPLTSFSILFARLKGDLDEFVKGAQAIENLKDGDLVLILESCTHHAIEDDIGRVKIPNLLRKKTGKNLVIHNYAGHDFPDLKDYKLVIHCGACMTNRREVLSRILIANQNGVPITNYGVAISYCLGILPRATKIFSPKV